MQYYWDGGWKVIDMDIGYDVKKLGDQSLWHMNGDEGESTLFFGNYDGTTYLLYGWPRYIPDVCGLIII